MLQRLYPSTASSKPCSNGSRPRFEGPTPVVHCGRLLQPLGYRQLRPFCYQERGAQVRHVAAIQEDGQVQGALAANPSIHDRFGLHHYSPPEPAAELLQRAALLEQHVHEMSVWEMGLCLEKYAGEAFFPYGLFSKILERLEANKCELLLADRKLLPGGAFLRTFKYAARARDDNDVAAWYIQQVRRRGGVMDVVTSVMCLSEEEVRQGVRSRWSEVNLLGIRGYLARPSKK